MTVSQYAHRKMRLLVVLPPSFLDAAVRSVFEQAAKALGLTFGSETLSPEDFGDSPDVDILVCADAGRHSCGGEKRLVILSRSPAVAAQGLVENLAVPARDAFIFVSRCYEVARSLTALGVPSFWVEDLLEQPRATLGAILDAGDIQVLDPVLDELSRGLLCVGKPLQRDVPDDVAAPHHSALVMYGPKMIAAAEPEAWWDRTLFRWGDHPELECPEMIDITGAARMLAFGPFITLPSGRWRAELYFDLCDDAARRFYLVEFGAGADLSRRTFRMAEARSGSVSIEHDFSSPAPAEIRFWVARAAFHGHLGFRGVKMTSCSRA